MPSTFWAPNWKRGWEALQELSFVAGTRFPVTFVVPFCLIYHLQTEVALGLVIDVVVVLLAVEFLETLIHEVQKDYEPCRESNEPPNERGICWSSSANGADAATAAATYARVKIVLQVRSDGT